MRAAHHRVSPHLRSRHLLTSIVCARTFSDALRISTYAMGIHIFGAGLFEIIQFVTNAMGQWAFTFMGQVHVRQFNLRLMQCALFTFMGTDHMRTLNLRLNVIRKLSNCFFLIKSI